MIDNIQLQNFKSLCEDEPLCLDKLSILCGSNSSGKSSLIQAILMLSQTLSSRYSEDAVVLNGQLTRLGSFEDIKNYISKQDRITLSFRLKIKREFSWARGLSAIDARIAFGGKGKTGENPEDDLHPSLLEASFGLTREVDEEEVYEYLKISKPEDSDLLNELGGKISSFKIEELNSPELEFISKEFPDWKAIGIIRDGFLPTTILIDYDHTKKISAQVISMITGLSTKRGIPRPLRIDEPKSSLPTSFFKSIRDKISEVRAETKRSIKINTDISRLLRGNKAIGENYNLETITELMLDATFSLKPSIIKKEFLEGESSSIADWISFLESLSPEKRKALTELIDKHRDHFQNVWYEGTDKERRTDTYQLRSFRAAAVYLTEIFSRSIKYLGPLRNEPLAIYPSIGQIDPNNVGLKGEFTAAVLHINKGRVINYPSPVNGLRDSFSFEKTNSTLMGACKDWLSYLGVINEFRTIDKGKLGYEIHVKTSPLDKWNDLTHVGVGVSQVLPIVLMSLLSDPDDVLIFEQPELHLHPKIQSRLCDFFIAMSKFGRQCIVETHSEYFINRLRLRIAQSRDPDTELDSPVYFIDKADGKSRFKRVNISRFGAILDWPEDFFDQTDNEVEKILLEASKKKREEKNGRDENNARSN